MELRIFSFSKLGYEAPAYESEGTEIEEKARETIHIGIEKYKDIYDQKSCKHIYKVGDKVLLRNINSYGLDKSYDGPYEIISAKPHNYVITNDKNEWETTVHRNRIKKFNDNDA
ncbi:Retrovirus-related Pol polyprotein [Thelohanellus kitauei]|uniref:Retrovirus-related Pol polyprotein n=1 Tax=Thelohanellus kitauei TaxID=669202 RepID=A0A0C2N4D2_THEKT|nr:Retrovirus-related Pol polyprotein [Thelohanellus kitauei]